MADAQEKVLEFPTSVRDAYEKREALDRQIKKLQKQYNGLAGFIEKSVPPTDEDEKGNPFGVVEGIRVSRWTQKSLSWRKALDDIVSLLVPKTKQGDAKTIEAQHTKDVPRYTITDTEAEEV